MEGQIIRIKQLEERVKALEAEQADMVKILKQLWFAEGMPGDQAARAQEDLYHQTILDRGVNSLSLKKPNGSH